MGRARNRVHRLAQGMPRPRVLAARRNGMFDKAYRLHIVAQRILEQSGFETGPNYHEEERRLIRCQTNPKRQMVQEPYQS